MARNVEFLQSKGSSARGRTRRAAIGLTAVLLATSLLALELGMRSATAGPAVGSDLWNLQQKQKAQLDSLRQDLFEKANGPAAAQDKVYQEFLRQDYIKNAKEIKDTNLAQDTRKQVVKDLLDKYAYKDEAGNIKEFDPKTGDPVGDIERTGSYPKDVRADVDLNAKTEDAAKSLAKAWSDDGHEVKEYPHKYVDLTTDTTLWRPCADPACLAEKVKDLDAWTTEGGLAGTDNAGRIRDPKGYYIDNEKKYLHGQEMVGEGDFEEGLKTVAKSIDKPAIYSGMRPEGIADINDPGEREFWRQAESLRKYGDPVEAGIADPLDSDAVVKAKVNAWLQDADARMSVAKERLFSWGDALEQARQNVQESLANSNPADPENQRMNQDRAKTLQDEINRVRDSNEAAQEVNRQLAGAGAESEPGAVTDATGWDSRLKSALFSENTEDLSPWRQQLNAMFSGARFDRLMDHMGRVFMAKDLIVNGAKFAEMIAQMAAAYDLQDSDLDEEANKHYQAAQALGADLVETGAFIGAFGLFMKAFPTAGGAVATWQLSYSGTRWVLENTKTGEVIDRGAGKVADKMLDFSDQVSDTLDSLWNGDSQSMIREKHVRIYTNALKNGALALNEGVTQQALVDAVRGGRDITEINRTMVRRVSGRGGPSNRPIGAKRPAPGMPATQQGPLGKGQTAALPGGSAAGAGGAQLNPACDPRAGQVDKNGNVVACFAPSVPTLGSKQAANPAAGEPAVLPPPAQTPSGKAPSPGPDLNKRPEIAPPASQTQQALPNLPSPQQKPRRAGGAPESQPQPAPPPHPGPAPRARPAGPRPEAQKGPPGIPTKPLGGAGATAEGGKLPGGAATQSGQPMVSGATTPGPGPEQRPQNLSPAPSPSGQSNAPQEGQGGQAIHVPPPSSAPSTSGGGLPLSQGAQQTQGGQPTPGATSSAPPNKAAGPFQPLLAGHENLLPQQQPGSSVKLGVSENDSVPRTVATPAGGSQWSGPGVKMNPQIAPSRAGETNPVVARTETLGETPSNAVPPPPPPLPTPPRASQRKVVDADVNPQIAPSRVGETKPVVARTETSGETPRTAVPPPPPPLPTPPHIASGPFQPMMAGPEAQTAKTQQKGAEHLGVDVEPRRTPPPPIGPPHIASGPFQPMMAGPEAQPRQAQHVQAEHLGANVEPQRAPAPSTPPPTRRPGIPPSSAFTAPAQVCRTNTNAWRGGHTTQWRMTASSGHSCRQPIKPWPKTIVDHVSVGAAAHGNAAAEGLAFRYQPTPGFHGRDSFTVTIDAHTTTRANSRSARIIVDVTVP